MTSSNIAKFPEGACFYFRDINNGVYRCGFATSQQPYDDAMEKLFQGLDKVRIQISRSLRNYCGEC